MKKKLNNHKGFTLVEIIAVLVILGILAAVAVPKYFEILNESRKKAAQGAIAEVRARASHYYAQKLMQAPGAQPTVAQIVASLGAAPDFGTEFGVAAAEQGTTGILITVGTIQGAAITPAVTGVWPLPAN